MSQEEPEGGAVEAWLAGIVSEQVEEEKGICILTCLMSHVNIIQKVHRLQTLSTYTQTYAQMK